MRPWRISSTASSTVAKWERASDKRVACHLKFTQFDGEVGSGQRVVGCERRVMSFRMGIVGIHPAVFVRVANTGLTGYGTWKSAQRIENKGFANALFARNSK